MISVLELGHFLLDFSERISSFEFLFRLSSNRRVDFNHKRDDQVKDDQNHDAPKANEVDPWQNATSHYSEHVTSQEPVVDNHDVEQSDEGCG